MHRLWRTDLLRVTKIVVLELHDTIRFPPFLLVIPNAFDWGKVIAGIKAALRTARPGLLL